MRIQEDTGLKTREYGADLLRIYLMFLIVLHHCIAHGFGMAQLSRNLPMSYAENHFPMFILNSLAVIAVNGFFWISGYFSIKRKWKKMLRLALKCILYAAAIHAVLYLAKGDFNFSLKTFASTAVRILTSYWFIEAYLCLCFLAPYLNQVLKSITHKEGLLLLSGLVFIDVYWGFLRNVLGIGRGYTLFQAVCMYIIGYYCRQYMASEHIHKCRKGFLVCGYLILSVITGMMAYFLYTKKQYSLSWLMYSYNNSLVMISAAALCLAFASIRNSTLLCRKLSHFSAYMFGVYLLTDCPVMREYLYIPLQRWLDGGTALFYPLKIIAFAVLVFITAAVSEALLSNLTHLLNRRKEIVS